jgi:hypothetical protein
MALGGLTWAIAWRLSGRRPKGTEAFFAPFTEESGQQEIVAPTTESGAAYGGKNERTAALFFSSRCSTVALRALEGNARDALGQFELVEELRGEISGREREWRTEGQLKQSPLPLRRLVASDRKGRLNR